MRDRLLHDALRTLTEDAADLLDGRLAAGEEIPFEVGETGPTQAARRSTALYAYRPLTSEFVASHAEQLRSLEAFEHAVDNIARTHGAVAYLRSCGEPVLEVSAVTHARLAVLAFLARVWQDAESFGEFDARFGRAYVELESVVLAARLVTTAFIPVYGVVLETDEVNLGDGAQLVAADMVDEECAARFADEPRAADCYCTISIDAPSDAPLPLSELRHEARCALTALRLFKPGSVSFGLTAHSEVAGVWQAILMPFSGRAREEAWRLLDGEDDELRQFMAAVRRVEKRTTTSWALKRFEMGLERTVPAEGLTDFMAAARALLEADDDAGRAALPARIAALCARQEERERVMAAVECSYALERLAIRGSVGKRERERLASSSPLETIAEIERCLRALLHDLVCGYLDTDLKRVADEILLADGQPASADQAIDREAGFDEGFYRPAEDLADGGQTDGQTQEFEVVFDDTAEIAAADLRLADEFTGGDAVLGDQSAVEQPEGDSSDAPTTEINASGRAGQPGDNWTRNVLHENDKWWTPEKSRADIEATQMPGSGDDAPASNTDADADAFEQTTQSYPELDADARINQLANELVDSYDRALTDTFEDDAISQDASAVEATAAEGPTALDPEEEARMSFTPPGEADLTFDFPVLARAMSRERDRHETGTPAEAADEADRRAHTGLSPQERIDFLQKHSGLTTEFPVPEFDVPDRVRQERLRELLGDRVSETASFGAIMSGNFEQPEAPSQASRPAPPPVREQHDSSERSPADPGRPRLVALKGGAQPVPEIEQPVSDPDVTTPASAGPATPAVDTAEPAWSKPDWSEPDPVDDAGEPVDAAESVGATETPADDEPANSAVPATDAPADAIDHGEARTSAIGPATIEFRPLVDGNPEDPDDFAGAC